jgi:hypothetical protein
MHFPQTAPADTEGRLRLEGAGHGLDWADWEVVVAVIVEHG